MRSFCIALVSIGILAVACDEQEIKSNCEPDGPCEAFLLLQCDCCSADKVEACRTDRRTACATGRLQLTQSADECQASVDEIEALTTAGNDYCEGFGTEQLETTCVQTILDPEGGASGAGGAPEPMTPADP